GAAVGRRLKKTPRLPIRSSPISAISTESGSPSISAAAAAVATSSYHDFVRPHPIRSSGHQAILPLPLLGGRRASTPAQAAPVRRDRLAYHPRRRRHPHHLRGLRPPGDAPPRRVQPPGKGSARRPAREMKQPHSRSRAKSRLAI